MAEYIERESLLKKAKELANSFAAGCFAAPRIVATIENAPKADVVEVKHSYWKRQKGRPEAICLECGREVVYQTINNKWWFENYCPHCGAKMDLKEGADK